LGGGWYRFIGHVFVDRGGERFLSEVSTFEPVEWRDFEYRANQLGQGLAASRLAS
jgi:hypothetical protein